MCADFEAPNARVSPKFYRTAADLQWSPNNRDGSFSPKKISIIRISQLNGLYYQLIWQIGFQKYPY